MRATRAQELGLVKLLNPDGNGDARIMAEALRALPRQDLPSDVMMPGLLDGLATVGGLLQRHVAARSAPARRRVVGRV